MTPPSPESTELWYTLELDIKPGSVDAFLEAFRLAADATRREPGVLQYDLLRDVKNPQNFNLVQRYASRDALRFHMEQPYTRNGLALMAGLLVKPYRQTDYVLAY